jgi:hypothetical protein
MMPEANRSHQQELSQWREEVSKRMLHLSKPQASVSAVFGLEMAVVRV